jgi:hypothetical protein
MRGPTCGVRYVGVRKCRGIGVALVTHLVTQHSH